VGYSKRVRQQQLRKAFRFVFPFLLAVSDYKRLYLTIISFHTELKLLVMVSHDMNSLTLTRHTMFD